jgi:hypothetical protein
MQDEAWRKTKIKIRDKSKDGWFTTGYRNTTYGEEALAHLEVVKRFEEQIMHYNSILNGSFYAFISALAVMLITNQTGIQVLCVVVKVLSGVCILHAYKEKAAMIRPEKNYNALQDVPNQGCFGEEIVPEHTENNNIGSSTASVLTFGALAGAAALAAASAFASDDKTIQRTRRGEITELFELIKKRGDTSTELRKFRNEIVHNPGRTISKNDVDKFRKAL